MIKTYISNNIAHGGVPIFIESKIVLHLLPRFCQTFFQSCTIEFKLNNTKLTIALLYISSKHNVIDLQFTEYLSTIKNTIGIILIPMLKISREDVM